MNLQISSNYDGTDYALHGLCLRGHAHAPNDIDEFFVLRDTDTLAKTHVRLFLNRVQLLLLKYEVDAMVAQLQLDEIKEQEAVA